MGKKAKKRKEMDLKVAPWQADNVTEQASSWPASGKFAACAGLPHQLDPDGDVVLILNSSSFIPEQSGYRIQNEDPRIHPNATPEEQNISSEPGFQGLVSEDIDEPAVGETVAAESAIEDLTVGGSMLAVKADEELPYEMFHVRVSSKHLILASPVFKKMLQVSFKEGQQLSSQGHTELPLPDDNPAALLVLLNLIHGQIRKVPRTVDLLMLTNLAILVDKYELLEATEMIMDHWIQGLESDIPLSFTNDLLPWMCLSWVFRKPEIFSKVTRVAQLESEGLLEVNQLPIPQSVLDKINHCRQDTLSDIFAYLQGTLEIYQGSKRICPQGIECDGMLLGSLTISLKAINILQPPLPPYNGFSVKGLLERLKEMRVPQYCNRNDRRNSHDYYSYSRVGICEGVERPLEAKTEELLRKLQGLEWTDRISF